MKEKIEKFGVRKIIIGACFLVLLIILLFVGAFLYNRFFYRSAYSEIEINMVKAAKNHMSRNPNDLPKTLNGYVTLDVADLARANEMKSLDRYINDKNITCTGKVVVTNVNPNLKLYRYAPFLDCGDDSN